MDVTPALMARRPGGMAEAEWRARIELAACYRIFDHFGWTELIYNHITLRVDGPERHYLINPFGLNYNEVTAGNLVKVRLDGSAVDASPFAVNRAGFVIHSAIHSRRDDAHCIMHVHTTAGMAVACKEGGLAYDNFYSAQLWGDIAYHDYEGVTTRTDEQDSLADSMGGKHCLILRNHGLLACEESVPVAFFLLFTLNRACEIQMASGAIPGPNRALTPEAIAASSHRLHRSVDPQGQVQQKVFDAMARRAGIVSYEAVL